MGMLNAVIGTGLGVLAYSHGSKNRSPVWKGVGVAIVGVTALSTVVELVSPGKQLGGGGGAPGGAFADLSPGMIVHVRGRTDPCTIEARAVLGGVAFYLMQGDSFGHMVPQTDVVDVVSKQPGF